MLQKLTQLGVIDGTGAGWLQVFHVYRGSKRRYAHLGDFVKLSIKSILSYPRLIRGRRYRPLRVGFVVRGLVVNTATWRALGDGGRFLFLSNNVALLKRRGTFKSKYLYSPLSRLIRKKQYRLLFKTLF